MKKRTLLLATLLLPIFGLSFYVFSTMSPQALAQDSSESATDGSVEAADDSALFQQLLEAEEGAIPLGFILKGHFGSNWEEEIEGILGPNWEEKMKMRMQQLANDPSLWDGVSNPWDFVFYEAEAGVVPCEDVIPGMPCEGSEPVLPDGMTPPPVTEAPELSEEQQSPFYRSPPVGSGAPIRYNGRLTCEGGGNVELACGEGESLSIISMFWGRRDFDLCTEQAGDLSAQKYSPSAPEFLTKVENECNGENACTLNASKSYFEDESDTDVFKYLEVYYDCN